MKIRSVTCNNRKISGVRSCFVHLGFRDETVEMSNAVPHAYGRS
jgi:hypothetical protein